MTPAPCLEGVGVAGAYTPLTVGHGGTARLTILPDISFFILFLSFKWVKNLSRKFSGAGCFKGFKGG